MKYLILVDEDDIKFCIDDNYNYSSYTEDQFVSIPNNFIFISDFNGNSKDYIKSFGNNEDYLSFYEDVLMDTNNIDNDKYIRPVESFDLSDVEAASINSSIDSVQIAKADFFYQVFTNNNPENIISSLSDLDVYELKDKSNVEIEHIVSNANTIAFFLEWLPEKNYNSLEPNFKIRNVSSFTLVSDKNDNIYYSFKIEGKPSQVLVPFDFLEEFDNNFIKKLEGGIKGCPYEPRINNIIYSDLTENEKRNRIKNQFRNLYQFIEEVINDSIKENEEYVHLRDVNPLTESAYFLVGVENVSEIPMAILNPLIDKGVEAVVSTLERNGYVKASKFVDVLKKGLDIKDVIDSPAKIGKELGNIKLKKKDKDDDIDLDL